MEIQPLQTENAPRAIGPYSQAVRVGGFLYLSGQVALEPATGELVGGGIEDQTRRVFDNLKAVLEAAGSGLSSVVKVHVYLTDINNFPKLNEIYGEFFSDHQPARSCVEVAGLPKGAMVEMDMIALG